MDLEIKYDNGSMMIHVEAFLGCRSIAKVRKLVKVIQRSYNPETLDKMKEFVEQELEQFEPRIKEDDSYLAGYTPKLKFSQQQLDKSVCIRSRFKRNSEGWKRYNELVKQYREEVRELKAQMRSRDSDKNDRIRNKAFYEKVLETIS